MERPHIRGGEAGLTLIELLVSAGIALVMITTALAGLQIMAQQQPQIASHGIRVQQARAALERVTRLLRETYDVNASSSSTLDVMTYARSGGQPAAQWRVVVTCSGESCTLQDGPAAGPLGAEQLVFSGLTNTDVFATEPDNVNPKFVRVKLRFKVAGSSADVTKPVTLSEGVEFRNVSSYG